MKALTAFAQSFGSTLYDTGFSDTVRESNLLSDSEGYVSALPAIDFLRGATYMAAIANDVSASIERCAGLLDSAKAAEKQAKISRVFSECLKELRNACRRAAMRTEYDAEHLMQITCDDITARLKEAMAS